MDPKKKNKLPKAESTEKKDEHVSKPVDKTPESIADKEMEESLRAEISALQLALSQIAPRAPGTANLLLFIEVYVCRNVKFHFYTAHIIIYRYMKKYERYQKHDSFLCERDIYSPWSAIRSGPGNSSKSSDESAKTDETEKLCGTFYYLRSNTNII